MTETAAAQLNRILSIVADFSRREAQGEPAPTVSELATTYGTTPEQIQRDVRTLTLASDDPDVDWLNSLAIWQEGDRVSVLSRGPFRRPIRFTAEEMLAIQLGLAMETGEPPALSCGLAALVAAAEEDASRFGLRPSAGEGESGVVALVRRAMDERRMLEILYTGERAAASTRVIEPHQVAYAGGRYYIVAWCRKAGGWRNFRADRVLEASPLDERFVSREDFRPFEAEAAIFTAPHDDPDEVRVRFSPGIARWLAERFPGAARADDGSLVVTYSVFEPAWLVRTVLQYGPDAEVLAPAEYRLAMRRAVASAAA